MVTTTWTNATSPTTTWADAEGPLTQPETFYDDTNTYDVGSFGKGYYYNDSIAGGNYTTASPPTTVWTDT